MTLHHTVVNLEQNQRSHDERRTTMIPQMTRRVILLGAAVVAMVAAAAMAPAAMARTTTCPEFNPEDTTDSTVYQSTAENLVVPAGHSCVIYNAHITSNVTVQSGAFFAAMNSTIGNNLISRGASVVYTGVYYTPGGKGPGHVTVGHNIVLKGSSYNLDFCDTTVGNDFIVRELHNAYELQIGDSSKQDLDYTGDFYSCQGESEGKPFSLSPPVTINHNLTIKNSSFGLLDVANDSIGYDLTVTNDVTTYAQEDYLPAGQGTWVNNNTNANRASCVNDTPTLANPGPDAQPNQAGTANSCTF